MNNKSCVYCGCKNHTSGNCTSQPNDKREELRSSPKDLDSLGPHLRTNTKYSGVPCSNTQKPPSRDQKTLKILEDFQILDNKHIQMNLSHTGTTGTNRTELDVNKPGLMSGTIDSTLQTTIMFNPFH